MTRKLLFFFFIGFIICATPLFAQKYQQLEEKNTRKPNSYPIRGSHLLWKNELEISRFIKEHPEVLQQNALRKTEAYSVGSTHSFYADDFTTNAYEDRYLVPSTCRAVGTNCYVFVENSSWGSRVTQAAVDSVKLYFDSKTPADATKGIYRTDVDAFGNPPNVDNDPKIIILLLDIRDGYDGSGGYVEGYFYSLNELPKTQYSTSNYAEIFFLDTNPLDVKTDDGIYSGMSTLAHEFQHMIHWICDNDEMTFVNEGCSLLAEVNCGFPIYSPSRYANEPNHYLLDWRRDDNNAVLTDYSRAARFFVYLRDQVGMGAIKNIVASKSNDTSGIDAGLQASSSILRFSGLLRNWFIANMLDDRNVDPKYGYLYPHLPKPAEQTVYKSTVSPTTENVDRYAVRYIGFKGGSELRATFSLTNPALIVKAIEIGPSSKRVLDVTNGVEFYEPLYGSTYSEVHFAIMNINAFYGYNYTYQATQTTSGVQIIELKYDNTEPTGVLPLADRDTICVAFNAIQGGILDSIRVALRRNTPITGNIWKFTGVGRPTPLGQPLTSSFTISGLVWPSQNGEPYPVPWPNWVTVDLKSRNISTNSAFAVGFIVNGEYSGTTNNRVMVTEDFTPTTPSSFSYSSTYQAGANWYNFTSGEDSMYYYLIRAYVSLSTNNVQQTLELNPIMFHLGQNYPNPFNPSTTIQFSLPSRMYSTLKVYDMLGREVATLIEGVHEAGSHIVKFDASHLPSGIYFYRIVTDQFVETKRLVLLK
jgi:hypothetical protein